jgi:hypothetical protein
LSGSASIFLLAFFTISLHYSFAKLKDFVFSPCAHNAFDNTDGKKIIKTPTTNGYLP